MQTEQARYPIDLAAMCDWIASVTPPGGRVLEIGCGDGEVVRCLVARGFTAIGVDPNAAPEPSVLAVPVAELEAEPFDTVFASVSLHHIHDADEMTAALRRLTSIGSAMLVREFDRRRLHHEPTLRWWYFQRRAHEAVQPVTQHEVAPTFEEFAANWQSHMEHHVLAWADVLARLEACGFESLEEERIPYLFRWELSEAVRPLEAQLIAQGTLRDVGIRWAGRRAR